MATVEKIEKDMALEKVEAADKKVNAIITEREAKKAARIKKRSEWKHFKFVGKIINAYDENPVEMWTGTLLGGGLGAGAAFGIIKLVDHFKSDKTDEDEPIDEVVEDTIPFEE